MEQRTLLATSWPLLAYVWLESHVKRTRGRQERALLHALTSVLPPALQYVVFQPLQHHHHHHHAHQEPQDHSEPQDPQDQLDFQDQQDHPEAQDQLDHPDHQEPQLDQPDHPEDQDLKDHPDPQDPPDPQDQLDQTAHQDHWEPQPHHHHHPHHHHAQLSASPSVSQHAQLTVAHRRNIKKRINVFSYSLEWLIRLLPIVIFRLHPRDSS